MKEVDDDDEESDNNDNYIKENKKINNDINFSPKKTNLSENISRNPNLMNYNKNKKLFIPINVMNLVSFINSQKNDFNNSITALNIFPKIRTFKEKELSDFDQNTNNQISKNVNIFAENKDLFQNIEQNYNQDKNMGILEKTALSDEVIPYFPNGNFNNNNLENNNNFFNNNNYTNNVNQNNYSVSYYKNKITFENNNDIDYFNSNNNKGNNNNKFIKFNNFMFTKKQSFDNIHDINYEFLNNQ